MNGQDDRIERFGGLAQPESGSKDQKIKQSDNEDSCLIGGHKIFPGLLSVEVVIWWLSLILVKVHQLFSMLSFRPFLIRRLTDEKSAGISSFNLLKEILVAIPKWRKGDVR